MAETPRRTISLGHGSGGLLTHDLVREVFGSRLANPILDGWGDSALLELGGARIAFIHPKSAKMVLVELCERVALS